MEKLQKIMSDTLALTKEQKEAFKELAKAIVKCKELGMAIIDSGTGTFAVNDEHIYDVLPNYNDWTVERVDLRNQERVPFIKIYHAKERCGASMSIAFDNDTAGKIYETVNNI